MRHQSWFHRLFRRQYQEAIIFNGFRGAVEDSLQQVEGKGYACNDKTREAWGISEQNQIMDRETGQPVQFLTAWSATPIVLFGRDDTKLTRANVNAVASRVVDEEIAYENERQRKSTIHLWVAIIAVILTLAVAIPIFVQLTSKGGGDIKIPGLS